MRPTPETLPPAPYPKPDGEAAEETCAFFIHKVPLSTKAAFKAACAKRNISMRTAVMSFLQAFDGEDRGTDAN